MRGGSEDDQGHNYLAWCRFYTVCIGFRVCRRWPGVQAAPHSAVGFQHPALRGTRNARQNICFGQNQKGLSKDSVAAKSPRDRQDCLFGCNTVPEPTKTQPMNVNFNILMRIWNFEWGCTIASTCTWDTVEAVAGGQHFICYSVFKPLLNIGCWTWSTRVSGGLSILVWAFPLASQDQTRHENAKSMNCAMLGIQLLMPLFKYNCNIDNPPWEAEGCNTHSPIFPLFLYIIVHLCKHTLTFVVTIFCRFVVGRLIDWQPGYRLCLGQAFVLSKLDVSSYPIMFGPNLSC